VPRPVEEAGEARDDVAEAAGLGERRHLGGELQNPERHHRNPIR
jgi:hypothetical protein